MGLFFILVVPDVIKVAGKNDDCKTSIENHIFKELGA